MNATSEHGGSKTGRKKNECHHRTEGHLMLDSDYFGSEPTHGPRYFPWHFRMKKGVFMRMVME